MIQFLAPWAAAGGVLLAGPLLIHMLLRRNARRVVFPAVQFLTATRAAAVRLRRPSDIGLLVVRLAIVGAAITAAAQPLVITPRRLAGWDARVVRAVVVDRSASVDANTAARLADQELASAFMGAQFADGRLPDALARAAAWLADAPPGRREVVIVSDFQRGAIDRADLDVLPAIAGIRTMRTGALPASRDILLPPVSGFRGAEWQAAVRLDAVAAGVTWTRSGAGVPAASWLTTSQAKGEEEAAARAVHAAVSPGVAPGDDTRRVHIRFRGAPMDSAPAQPVRTGWMVDATLALRRSALLDQTNAAIATLERNGQLVIDTTVAAAANDAAAVVRAVVLAVRPASIADREAEVNTIADAELATWRREAAPLGTFLDRRDLRTVPESDAKWFWGVALALLGVEAWLRRRDSRPQLAQVRDAA